MTSQEYCHNNHAKARRVLNVLFFFFNLAALCSKDSCQYVFYSLSLKLVAYIWSMKINGVEVIHFSYNNYSTFHIKIML